MHGNIEKTKNEETRESFWGIHFLWGKQNDTPGHVVDKDIPHGVHGGCLWDHYVVETIRAVKGRDERTAPLTALRGQKLLRIEKPGAGAG